jgi:hypothetical protein
MSKNLTLAVPIILAATVVTMPISMTTSRAADECLRGPNGTAPAGSHWYYRVDRSTGRHCWYVGAAGRSVRSVSERTSQQTRKHVEQHSRNSQAAAQPADKRPDLPAPTQPVPDSKAATSFFAQYWASLFGKAEPPKITPSAQAPQISAPAGAPQSSAPARAPQSSAPPGAQQSSAPGEAPQNAAPAEAPQTSAAVETPRLTGPADAPRVAAAADAPQLAAPIDASRPVTQSPASNYAQEPDQTDAQENMPLVWPVLSPEETKAAPLNYGHMLGILAGALALAGILMALVYRLASIRVDRRRQPERARWDPETRTMLPMPPIGDTDSFSFPRSNIPARKVLLPAPLLPQSPPDLDREPVRRPLLPKLPFELDRELRKPAPAQRSPEPDRGTRKPILPPPEFDQEARKPILPKRPPALEREGREPHEARRLRELRELREGLEVRLEQLRDARRRSAA